MPIVLAATGHRPSHLGPDGYSIATSVRLHAVATEGVRRIDPELVIVGMAQGWDLAVAHAAIDLGVPVHAAIPHDDHCARWPQAAQRRYHAILARCASWVVVTPGPFSGPKMHARNQYMADRCTHLLTLWDGSPSGTGNCIRYAQGLDPAPAILHMWDRWLEIGAECPMEKKAI